MPIEESLHVRFQLDEAVKAFEQSGIPSARLDASILLGHILGIAREEVLISLDRQLNNNEITQFKGVVARRQQHEPIAYIIGKKEFWSLDFCVTTDTLIPRPDSETLVTAALKQMQNLAAVKQAKPITLLDIGTGTGCLLIALLNELKSARGIGIDTSERALQVAEKNAQRLGVSARAQFIKSHWCDALQGTFDLIISNPPYIAEAHKATLMDDVIRYEPHSALFAGDDGLDAYRAIAPQLNARLNAQGIVVFEIGQGQQEAVAEILSNAGLTVSDMKKDLAGITRCVIACKMQ